MWQTILPAVNIACLPRFLSCSPAERQFAQWHFHEYLHFVGTAVHLFGRGLSSRLRPGVGAGARTRGSFSPEGKASVSSLPALLTTETRTGGHDTEQGT